MIKLPKHLPLEIFASIYKAGKKSCRSFERHVRSLDGQLSITDGNRLLVLDYPAPDGFYEVVKATKTEVWLDLVEYDVNYPDLDRVLNLEDKCGTTISTDRGYVQTLTEIIRFWQSSDVDQTIDPEFVREGAYYDDVKVSSEHGVPIFMRSKTSLYAVMPMNYEVTE